MIAAAVVEHDLVFAQLPGAMLERLFTRCAQLRKVTQRDPAIAPIVHERGTHECHTLQR